MLSAHSTRDTGRGSAGFEPAFPEQHCGSWNCARPKQFLVPQCWGRLRRLRPLDDDPMLAEPTGFEPASPGHHHQPPIRCAPSLLIGS